MSHLLQDHVGRRGQQQLSNHRRRPHLKPIQQNAGPVPSLSGPRRSFRLGVRNNLTYPGTEKRTAFPEWLWFRRFCSFLILRNHGH
jgi:hypothetical protein